MNKYKVLVCKEVWGTIEVEANNEDEAVQKVVDYEYESDFEPNGKTGNECYYGATLIEEAEA
ncbi:hypothetical protein BK138_16190 [Paenibacillus rhizosphaerae]|uniref:Uncharacterized protein n=1 Tax=Paenibacillus rhizosphaerae TaxID=297318 RepID=A0A1R1ES84_9BACL|nr:hypothetical protein [Paenibacillus rhizosphaerae]OMF54696.1 hypothetical protein BK138_16190 [Paenibacillus rhizosphaerae]